MPTVYNDRIWRGGQSLTLKVNINDRGVYYCTVPEPVAKHSGIKRLEGPGLNGVLSDLRALIGVWEKSAKEDE